MKKRFVWLFLSCLIAIVLMLGACAPAASPTPTSTPKPTPTTGPTGSPIPTPTAVGNWWDKFGTPQYGSEISYQLSGDPRTFDPYQGLESVKSMYLEPLSGGDWTLDRNTYPFQLLDNPPQYKKGLLAESWEQPDSQTIVFHIRKGVRWQDIPPMNGRELTAYDIEWSWHRQLGIGSGFTKPSPYIGTLFDMVTSVTATDKYTLVFKAKYPTTGMLEVIIAQSYTEVAPWEVVEKYGDLANWKNAIGTGPFILRDYISGSSLTFVKNPNYWGYDERHPQNQLPYVDVVKLLIIPDSATALAAMRTGKIDILPGITRPIAEATAKTNPEILQTVTLAYDRGFRLRCDTKPFTDIRVRKALQMSIDFKTIAKTYYGGLVNETPYGVIDPGLKDYYTPFDKWPQDVKDGFTYNPEGAKKLLAEAGYPNGFKTNVVAASNDDLDLAQIVKSYFAAIGVDMEIRTMDATAFITFVVGSKKQDQMVMYQAFALNFLPLRSLLHSYSTFSYNMTFNNDPVYDAMYDKAAQSLDLAEQKKLINAADQYIVAHFWKIETPRTLTINLYQPWVKGYSGEYIGTMVKPDNQFGWTLARFWIGQSLKKSMGQ